MVVVLKDALCLSEVFPPFGLLMYGVAGDQYKFSVIDGLPCQIWCFCVKRYERSQGLNILKPSGQTAWAEVVNVINHQNLPRCVSMHNFVSVARNEWPYVGVIHRPVARI